MSRRPAEPRQSLTTGTAAWKRWAKALLTTGGHFFNNAVQSNFILSVPFMQAASELLSRSAANAGRGKISGAGEVEAAQQHGVQKRLSCLSKELEEEEESRK